MTPSLSVVIPTYRRCEQLRQVLAACARQTLPARDFDVIVSIDGPEDDAEACLAGEAYPFALRWTHGPHGGPSAARNRGASLASGGVVVFLDDDIVPGPDCLAQHLALHARPSVVGLGQVVLAKAQRTLWECYLTERYNEHFAKLAQPGYALTFWDCLSGSLSLPAELLARSGGFDTSFTRHEDVEFGYRLDQLGANFVYAPRAVGEHCFTRSVEGGLRDALAEGHSAAHLTLRHPALCDRLLQARWRRYSPAGRAVMGWALAGAERHARMAAAAARLVRRVEASALPATMRRPVYQLACHLQFWLGVRGVEERLVPG